MNMYGQVLWSPGVTMQALERDVINAAMRHFRGNKTAAANSLGIPVRTFYTKLEKIEQENEEEKARVIRERDGRADFLERQRHGTGRTYGQFDTSASPSGKPEAAASDSSPSGLRPQSAAADSEEQPMSMSQRDEVQAVLPPKIAAGGGRSRR